MTPDAFIAKWQANTRNEAAASKEHFLDLCALLGVPTPNSDATGATYAFEKGVRKAAGGGGWADVWKRGCFGWEYKSRGGDLERAHDQLLRYAGALENPPLLISSDMDRIIVRTNWTNAVSDRRDLALEDLRDPAVRGLLKACWTDPDRWRPATTRQALTEQAAGDFAELARRLRARGHDPQAVAHFVNRLVFCLFADDVGLLPDRLLSGMLDYATRAPASFAEAAAELFRAMRSRGGRIGFQPVPWFNGGLFDDDTALPLDAADIALLTGAAALDWAEIDPSILGTLFERGLDPDKRSQLGAHYTDREKIGLLVEAVVVRPLLVEWGATRARIAAALEARAALLREARAPAMAEAAVLAGAEAITAESRAARTSLRRAADRRARKMAELLEEAGGAYRAFVDRLRGFRVLDPACGSGNFLYLSLLALKDLEQRVGIEAEVLGLEPALPMIGPEAVLGIEVNPFAAELARVSVWIGHIQWARRNGYPPPSDPVLRTLDTIQCRDAVLTAEGAAAAWPAANAIVGNPPFLGGKVQRRALGDAYLDRLFGAYAGRVPPEADFVCYWLEQAREAIAAGRTERAGLVVTNSVRGGASRKVLERIRETGAIYAAWSDEPWTLDGAAVRVSLLCFAAGRDGPAQLDGEAVPEIFADLTAGASDLTAARRLPENAGVCFMGTTKVGPFDIDAATARAWLALPTNANGRPNADVVRPWRNGLHVMRRVEDAWIVDFGATMTEAEAAFYAAPFGHVSRKVKAARGEAARDSAAQPWWRHGRPRPQMRRALCGLGRYIATPAVAKHRLFVWLSAAVVPDHQLLVTTRDDDTTFGILHSRFHEIWALRQGSWMGVGNDSRYTPSTTFETFPFPDGLTPNIPAATTAADPRAQRIAAAARALVEARDRWLNPPDLIERLPEVVPGFPDRLVPKDAAAAALLKRRTLTALYNTRGTPEGAWLDGLHRALDAAVAEAYGWPADIPEADALSRLLALNHARAGSAAASGPGARPATVED
ncbi:class I SAM-dependent DNA methyltransferase [Roseicella aquatilis]|uniref:site-specific DNA-methyltransferase (adenine-specific) n=1 Tax=Roseicella aquatilis TaxID=2527868 RepID=A0A4R4DMY3_9PROT|nr:DNA methyltransferase [Roseicella aquatilis]TCZ61302.1 class I SAM-dependent DNA methyltransferase [Roseicella aquatilis]